MTIATARLPVFCLVVTAAASTTGCDRVVREAKSPDGARVAFVIAVPDIDPPNQKLGIRSGQRVLELVALAPDNEACTSIFWREDGREVAFVVRGTDGTYIRVYDSFSGRLISRTNLAPPGKDVRQAHFRGDQAVAFDECDVQSGGCVGATATLVDAVRTR